MKDIYFKIFKESFFSYFVIPFSNESLFKTAIDFKNKEIFILSIFMLFGFLSANILNYLMGFVIERLSLKKQVKNNFISKINQFWMLIILLTSTIQYVGPIVVLMFGYIKFNPLKVIAVGIIGKILYSVTMWYW